MHKEPEAYQLPSPPETLDLTRLKDIANVDLPSARDVDLSFFSHRGRKSTQLIGNKSEELFVKARKEWLSFDLIDAVYVTTIEVFATGYEQYHEMEISLVDFISRNKSDETVKYNGSSFVFRVNKFLGGFGLKPTDRLFKESKVTSIIVSGIEQKYFYEVVKILENVTAERERVEKGLDVYLATAKKSYVELEQNRGRIDEQKAQIAENDELLDRLEVQKSELTAANNDLAKRIEIGASVEKERNERVEVIQLNINKLNGDRKSISDEISFAEKTMRELQNNIHLFPTEIAGYVKQGTANVKLYALLCIVPLAVISLMTYKLFSNSERLLDFFYNGSKIDIVDFLISRAPYVFVSAIILAVCYTVINRLISEIININRRRQDLFKVSIIATDISYASQDGMEMDTEERYNLRTQTKMEMLKEHLKHHMSEDFVYRPKHNFLLKLSTIVSRNVMSEEDSAERDAKALPTSHSSS